MGMLSARVRHVNVAEQTKYKMATRLVVRLALYGVALTVLVFGVQFFMANRDTGSVSSPLATENPAPQPAVVHEPEEKKVVVPPVGEPTSVPNAKLCIHVEGFSTCPYFRAAKSLADRMEAEGKATAFTKGHERDDWYSTRRSELQKVRCHCADTFLPR